MEIEIGVGWGQAVVPGNFTEEIAFPTPWFDLVARRIPTDNTPYYSLRAADYVSVVAETSEHHIVLVKQYRAAVDRITIELPSGHVDPGETPEGAALGELEEETGYTADKLTLAGVLTPDTGRIGNRMWCYFAKVEKMQPAPAPEDGIEVCERGTRELMGLIGKQEIENALSVAALFLVVARGYVRFEPIS